MPRGKRSIGTIRKRGDWYTLDYQTPLGRVRESAHTTDSETARLELARKAGDIATGRIAGPEKVTMAQLLQLVVSDYEENERSSTYDLRCRIDSVISPLIGKMRAAAITPTALKVYIAKRKSAGVSRITIRRELAIVKRAFNLGLVNEIVYRMPKFPTISGDNVREGFLENLVYRGLLDKLPPRLRCFFVIAFHTGMRKGRIKKIARSMVNFSDGLIYMGGKQSSTKKHGKVIPIYGDMKAWLDMRLSEVEGDLLFSDIGDFRKAWATACKAAGVPGLLFHDLRRTALRNMIRAGIPEKVAMEISGHKTRSVFDRYNIVDTRDIQDAGKSADTFLKKKVESETDATPDKALLA